MEITEVSLFKNKFAVDPVNASVLSVLEGIKAGKWREQVEEVRNHLQEPKVYDELKGKLPGVTFCGVFKKRKADQLIKYSHFICLDIDKLKDEKLFNLKKNLKKDPFVYAFFTSPSNSGLKVLIRLTSPPESHQRAFLLLEKYFDYKYQTEIDKSGKDVSRLCFVSYDPDLYLNEKAEAFNYLEYTFNLIVEFTDNKESYSEGNRNNYVHLLSCNCNRAGLPEDYALQFIKGYANDLPHEEVLRSVKSGYKNILEHGKYDVFRLGEIAEKAAQKEAEERGNFQIYKTTKGDFWYEIENQNTGKQSIEIHYGKLLEFLESNGFYRLPLFDAGTGTGAEFQIIRITKNIVEPVFEINIKDFVINWLKENNQYKPLEKIRRGAKTFFSMPVLEQLSIKIVKPKEDTKKECFLYFKNCWVSITSNKIDIKKYEQLDQPIWKSKIIDKDLNYADLTENQACEFQNFIACVTGLEFTKRFVKKDEAGEVIETGFNEYREFSESEKSDIIKQNSEKFYSVCTALGYLLHSYKDPSRSKAVVAVDAKISRRGEAHGRTGKSITGKALQYVKKVSFIAGRTFNPDKDNFPYENVDIDTDVVAFLDCNEKLKFDAMFNIITDDFHVNKKGQPAFVIPFERSPKIYIDTNYVIRGEGSSYSARQHIIEFESFFTSEYTPETHFGHLLFRDWDQKQWDYFYSFMVWCIQTYLQKGLVPFPVTNYRMRKLVDQCGEDFLEFMDYLKRDEPHNKRELFEQFQSQYPDYQHLKQNTFSRWIRNYCETFDIDINKHKNGDRDKRGKDEFITLSGREEAF